jgi:hypothetical protein
MPKDNPHYQNEREQEQKRNLERFERVQAFVQESIARDCVSLDDAIENEFLSGYFACLRAQGARPEDAMLFFAAKRRYKYANPHSIAQELKLS